MANHGKVNHALFGTNTVDFGQVLRSSAKLVVRDGSDGVLQFTIPRGERKANVELTGSQVDALIAFLEGSKASIEEVRAKIAVANAAKAVASQVAGS